MHVHTGRALRTAAVLLAGAALVTPPVAGAVRGAETPATVRLAPGLTVRASVAGQAASTVDFGALGAVTLPRVHSDVPLLGDLAVVLRVDPISLQNSDQDTLGLYAGLFDHPDNSLGRPVRKAIRRHIVAGIGIGLALDLTAAGVAWLAWLTLRRWRHQLEALGATGPTGLAQHDRTSRATALLASGAAVAVVATGLYVGGHPPHETVALTDSSGQQPLDKSLASLSTYLTGSTVSGSGAQLVVNRALAQVLQQKQQIDTTYSQLVPRVQDVVARVRASATYQRYAADPRYVPLLHISDLHCDLPYGERLLPALIHATGAKLVLNTGDTDISTGELPFEGQCTDVLANALQPTAADPDRVDMVAVAGNHDGPPTVARLRRITATPVGGGPSYHPVTVLDAKDDFTSLVDGIPFVGSPDPRRSTFGTEIQPSSAADQAAVIAKQGDALAPIACDGRQPILLTHDRGAASASLAQGCVGLALSGHTHVQAGPFAYRSSNGHIEPVMTQGTSSGVGNDAFTLYATPQRDAPQTVFIWDTAVGKVVGDYTVVVHPDGRVTTQGLVGLPAPVDLPDLG